MCYTGACLPMYCIYMFYVYMLVELVSAQHFVLFNLHLPIRYSVVNLHSLGIYNWSWFALAFDIKKLIFLQTRKRQNMRATIMTNTTAFGRSLVALRKNSKPSPRLSFSNDSHVANSSTAAASSTTRRRGIPTLSARNSNILNSACDLSHGLPYRFNSSTTTRFMSSSITTKIQHLLDNNKVCEMLWKWLLLPFTNGLFCRLCYTRMI